MVPCSRPLAASETFCQDCQGTYAMAKGNPCIVSKCSKINTPFCIPKNLRDSIIYENVKKW
jgi:hypothetical protein